MRFTIACLCILAVAAAAGTAEAEAAKAEAVKRKDEQGPKKPRTPGTEEDESEDESTSEETEDEHNEDLSELENESLSSEDDTETEENEEEQPDEDVSELEETEGNEDEVILDAGKENDEEIDENWEPSDKEIEETLNDIEELHEGITPEDLYLDGEHLGPITALQLHGVHLVIDENQDGKVSLEEIMHFSRKVKRSVEANSTFQIPKDLDLNNDGKLSWDEVMKKMDQLLPTAEKKKNSEIHRSYEEMKFNVADEDGDGFLEPDEVKTMWSDTHEEILHLTAQATQKMKDHNGDGQLTLHEFWDSDERWADVGHIPTADHNVPSEENHAEFKLLDKDGSGTLDIHELKAFSSGTWDIEKKMSRLLELADEDGDGHLNVDELSASRKTGLVDSGAHSHIREWVAHLEL